METRNRKFKILIVLIILFSLGAAAEVILASAKYGPGITHDSVAYMYSAQSFINGEGFQYFGYPSPFIQWPPLYPIMLALGELVGLTVNQTAILINSVAFALIVFFAGKWMRYKFKKSWIALSGALLISLSVPLLHVSQYLWTETMFILFLLLAYISMEKFILSGKYKSLIFSGIFSALACLERYAGVTIVASSCLVLLFSGMKINLNNNRKIISNRAWTGVINAAVYGAISIIPMGIWVIRNYIVSGTLLGVRLPSVYPLAVNIKRALQSIYTWVIPEELLSHYISVPILRQMRLLAIILPTVIIVASLIFLICKAVTNKSIKVRINASNLHPDEIQSSGQNRGLVSDIRKHDKIFPIAFFTLFSVVYVAYLIASATTVAFEPINSRYLIPIYIPIVLVTLTMLDGLLCRMKTHSLVGRVPIYLLAVLFLIYPLLNTVAAVQSSRQNGAGGYATDDWRERDGFLKYMKLDESLQTSGQVTYYSNYADVVYAFSGVRTYCLPKKEGPYMYCLEQFKASVKENESSMLIWLDGSVPETLYNLEELSAMFQIKEIGSFEYGKIYEIMK